MVVPVRGTFADTQLALPTLKKLYDMTQYEQTLEISLQNLTRVTGNNGAKFFANSCAGHLKIKSTFQT